ncbi:oligosaccharide flippase family protein [Mesorhizobium sp. WSM2561]|uniref:lipopolysaccharide biosynthesis protein n=1 Tax=Mesorhizobium sp. WSM2561 TaxID=1040985 RepID=UPI000489CB0C|nr:oligosaccharide flippase family protein [Mesorhizobium sp. WSM2561]
MFRSILTVLSGSVIAQLIAIAVLPALTRLYDAEAFGRYQIYLSVLNVAIMFSAFRYEVALLGARPGRVLENLLKVTFRLCIVTGMVAVLVVIVVDLWAPNVVPSLRAIIFILPGAMIVAGLYQMLSYVPIRERNYPLSARSKILQSIGFSVGALGCAMFSFIGAGLVLADIFGRVAGSISILLRSGKLWRTLISPISFPAMKFTAVRFKEFGFFTFPGTLLSALGAAVAPFAFLALFNLEVAGQYALVERFILMPVGIVAVAVSQVFTGEFAKLYRAGKGGGLNGAFRRALFQLLAIGLLPTVLGMVFSPSVVPFVFGADWVMAGKLCAIAFPIAYVRFVATALTMTLIIIERQSLQFAWELGRFLFTLLVFGWLGWARIDDPLIVMIWHGLATAVTYALQLALADHATKLVNLQVRESEGTVS